MAKLLSCKFGDGRALLRQLNKAGMTAEEAVLVKRDKDGILAGVMVDALRAHLNPIIVADASGSTTIELHMNERGTSNHGPPDGWAPKSLEIQHGFMRELWPKLELPSLEALTAPYAIVGERAKSYRKRAKPTVVLPDGCEGFFIEAKISGLLKLIQGDKGKADYNRVLNLLMSVLGERRKNFSNWTEDEFSDKPERAIEEWWKRRLAYEGRVQGDFVLYAADTGIKFRNWSVRASRAHMKHEAPSWIGGTSIDGSQIMLTHEERLTDSEHLGMDCAGSERVSFGSGRFSSAPYFYFSGKRLRFASREVWGELPFLGSLGLRLPRVA